MRPARRRSILTGQAALSRVDSRVAPGSGRRVRTAGTRGKSGEIPTLPRSRGHRVDAKAATGAEERYKCP
ncbi:MAG: hypothetical protein AB2705_10605 [Candidatus Thiodiazotropha sp.]